MKHILKKDQDSSNTKLDPKKLIAASPRVKGTIFGGDKSTDRRSGYTKVVGSNPMERPSQEKMILAFGGEIDF